MSRPPLISVVTPTKNRLALLTETIESVRAQTLTDWEHIVVDDGSDDGTETYVTELARTDPRIRYLRRQGEASGANVCRNLALSQARGQFVVFLDSDDLVAPGCLANRVAVMERNADLDFATFRTGFFVEAIGDLAKESARDLLGDDLASFLYFELPWIITGPIWRLEALRRIGGFDENLRSWQDVELHVRALTAGCRYLRFAEVDHHIRWQFEPTKISILQRRSPQHLNGAAAIIEILEGHVRSGPGMNWVRRQALCSLYFFVAERWIEIGRLGDALRCWNAIRRRGLGSVLLHTTGAALLMALAARLPVATLLRKWQGWMRLRTHLEVISG